MYKELYDRWHQLPEHPLYHWGALTLIVSLIATGLVNQIENITVEEEALVAQVISATPSSIAPGGFLEPTSSLLTRSRLSATEIQNLLPPRGRFLFPAPYGTEGIRLTNASDCGGSDCVLSVGYSYWRNINNHVGSDTLLVVLGLDRRYGGSGPTLFRYNKVTGLTENLGALFSTNSPYGWSSTEGWYFSATNPTMLYLFDGPKLLRYDVLSRAITTVFDVTTYFGSNRIIWQTHTSQDDLVHSFTLRDSSTYSMLGCGVYLEASGQFKFYPAKIDFDECQVDKSGQYIVIKDQLDGLQGEDNLIVDLTTGAEQTRYDSSGAGGHSDVGFGYMVAEDNFHPLPGAVRTWVFGTDPNDGSQGRLVSHVTDWSFGSNHIAHADAHSGVPLSQQVACSSNVSRQILPRANEIICYRLDGSLEMLVVAPVMTDLDASGGGTDEYWKLPKGNVDVTGEYFIWVSNMGGARQDAFLVRVPTHLLVQTTTPPPPPPPPPSGDTTAPTVSLTTPSSGSTVSGTVTVSANASDNVGVSGVQFILNGSNLGSEDTSSPYSTSWNTTSIANGSYTLSARARDAAGNTSTASAVSVTVNNTTTPPPSTKFSLNDRVQTTASVQVRSTAGGTSLGTQSLSAIGTVVGGPTYAAISGTSYWWWNVNFDSGVDGWVAEDLLIDYVAPPVASNLPTLGSRVYVTATKLNVRPRPGSGNIGFQYLGNWGTVIEGPIVSGSNTWWRVNFDINPDGWVAQDWIRK